MPRHSHQRGFTLVELLVVLTIIGVLVALLLPAIQAAREAARRDQCKNHLHQLALGAIAHEEQQGHFPTGGWFFHWVGDADRGFGQDQTGGWAYNILPFIEESNLRDLPGDGQPGVVTERQLEGARQLLGSAIPIMNCPSRRAAKGYAHDHLLAPDVQYPGYKGKASLYNGRAPLLVGKLDYAMNAGEKRPDRISLNAPRNLREAANHLWCNDRLGNAINGCVERNINNKNPLGGNKMYNGVCFRRSEVAIRHVTDGTSNTYLIGEKFLIPEGYEKGPRDAVRAYGDRFAWCVGFATDNLRTGRIRPLHDASDSEDAMRYPRGHGDANGSSFGSAHAAGFHMSFCDGSVRVVDYDIDHTVHLAHCNRSDGLALP